MSTFVAEVLVARHPGGNRGNTILDLTPMRLANSRQRNPDEIQRRDERERLLKLQKVSVRTIDRDASNDKLQAVYDTKQTEETRLSAGVPLLQASWTHLHESPHEAASTLTRHASNSGDGPCLAPHMDDFMSHLRTTCGGHKNLTLHKENVDYANPDRVSFVALAL